MIRNRRRAVSIVFVVVCITIASIRQHADTGTCGGQMITLPFGDVSSGNIFFCSIAEAFFSGLTNGTTATTYSPAAPVPREQMAAFVTRTMDQSVKRSSRRAALNQYWTIQGSNNLGLTTVGSTPFGVQSDGADLWVANWGSGTVSRVRASDGKLLDTWTGATSPERVLCAAGEVFLTGATNPGSLYLIFPTQPGGAVITITNALGAGSIGIAFDGQRVWTANFGTGAPSTGSVSIISFPSSLTTVTTGFTSPEGIVYDGTNIWVTDNVPGSIGKLHKLDSSGNILLSVEVGSTPFDPAFDGTNIWVPNLFSNTVTVVRATGGLAGTVLATLSGNGLNRPLAAAFDGERIIVTNNDVSGLDEDSVSLWNASDFTPIGTFSMGVGSNPIGACSDGLNFWITLSGTSRLARF
jgi:hypothetical protein